MRIEFTVTGPRGPRDVAVSGSAATPFAAVVPALTRLVGAAPGTPARIGAAPVAGVLGDGAVRTGSLVDLGSPAATAPAPAVEAVALHQVRVVGGSRVEQPRALTRAAVVVGRDPDCDLVLDDDQVSRRHACFRATAGGVRVEDLGSTNGTTVDGRPLPGGGRVVVAGELVRIGDSLLTVGALDPADRAVTLAGGEGTVRVHRAPRDATAATAAVIDRDPAPRVPPPGRVQWIAALVPALAGAGLAWLLSAPMFLLFAVLSPVVLLGTAAGDRWHWRRDARRGATLARRRRAAFDDRVATALRAETRTRRARHPDPAAVLDIAGRPGRRMWERDRHDPDFLVVRIGASDDASRTLVREGATTSPVGSVPTVPVVVDLRDGPLGIVGPPVVTREVARSVVAHLAAMHTPADVRLAVPGGAPAWSWCRWLPHLEPCRGDGVAAADLMALRHRGAATGHPVVPSPAGTDRRDPWTVVVADHLAGADAGALTDLLADEDGTITAVCLAGDTAALPAACRTIALVDPVSTNRLTLLRRDHEPREAADPGGPEPGRVVLADRVTAGSAEVLARALAPFTDGGSRSPLPAAAPLADLVDLTDVDAVVAAWHRSDGGARTVLGVSRDGPVDVDLVSDGPHALVAGTTGSGKSELLRTLVLGLAAAHPPDVVSFLLVDYKGGAAFGDAERLPHTTAVLTDLDATLTARALASLHAELRRRERLFAAVGAEDLADYRRHRDPSPVARLVVVVDEFAELVSELPDFVTGLIAVARRGRSLGVHLVLATQRPGTAVSAEIRANTSLRIALRVIDPAESRDVVDVPDAARIDPARPGRAFLRRGDRVVDLQTARVMTPTTVSSPVVEPLGPWRRPADDDATDDGTDEATDDATGAGSATVPPDDELRRTVDLIRAAAEHRGSTAPGAAWLPPLPDALPLREIETDGIALGRLDEPDRQAQPVFGLDPDGDSVLVVGRPRSGRTGALVTAAVSATRTHGPSDLEVHVIDGGESLAAIVGALPHLGTVATRRQPMLVARLLERLAERPRVDTERRRTLLLIDDWDRLLDGRDDADVAHWHDRLGAVVRTVGADLSVMIAGGRSLLMPRTAAGFATRLVLPLADVADYGLAGVPTPAIPAGPSPGGGIRLPGATAFRLAHAGDAPTVASARADVAAIAGRTTVRAPARRLRLRALPDHVPLADLRTRVTDRTTGGLALGLAGDTAAPCVLDLVRHRARMLVAGPARAGRSTLLLTATTEARRLGHDVVVVAPARSPLRAVAGPCTATSDGEPPRRPTLLVVDDVEAVDEAVTDRLAEWLRDDRSPVAVLVAGRNDELVTSFRGLVTEVRRDRCGVLLRPGVLDGELLGVRLRREPDPPPGRGVIVGDPRWSPLFAGGGAVPFQVATP